MAGSHFTGPLLNVEKNRGLRESYSNLPIGQETDYHTWMSDFDKTLDATNEYVVVKDGGATAAIGTDAAQGTLIITSTATTDNDGGLVMSIQESWKLATGKPCWFRTKVKNNKVAQSELFFGLAVQVATNPENCATAADRIGFEVLDGDASILYVGEKGGALNTGTDSGIDMVNDIYVDLAFYFNGKGRVDYYINEVKIASDTNVPDDEELAIALYSLSGDNLGTRATTIDYVYVCQKR